MGGQRDGGTEKWVAKEMVGVKDGFEAVPER